MKVIRFPDGTPVRIIGDEEEEIYTTKGCSFICGVWWYALNPGEGWVEEESLEVAE